MHQKIKEKALAKAAAMLGFCMWLVGVTWHGVLGNPSMMTYMYPWFDYSNPLHAGILGAIWIIAFFALGYLIAYFYNWNLERS